MYSWEGALEEEMATHSSIFASLGKIPWTEEPGGLQSMGLQKVGDKYSTPMSVFPGGSTVKKLLARQEIWFQFLGWEDFPGEGNGNPLHNTCLGNPMDSGTWPATVHGVARFRYDLAETTTTTIPVLCPFVI